MTAEMHKLANDPNFVVQFAIGNPIPNLIAQSKDSGIRMSGVYFDTTKRYIMKHAHMSKEDVSNRTYYFFQSFAIVRRRFIIFIILYIHIFLNVSCSVFQVRIFDVANGTVVMVSHHPGKNPYEKLDPLGLGNGDKHHAVAGGEWASATDVTGHHGHQSFKIRPKALSRHGRQYIKKMHGKYNTFSLLTLSHDYMGLTFLVNVKHSIYILYNA
jgi:hypothetical protein